MNNKILSILVSKVLPTISGGSLTYDTKKKVLRTLGYTSAAGNSYYQTVRISKRLVVFYDIGVGYALTFLNGIKLFCWDGTITRLIGQRYWGGNNWRSFNESFARDQSIIMLKEFLAGQAKLAGGHVSESQLLTLSRQMVDETRSNLIA